MTAPRRKCPLCGKPATARDRPFCSPLCAERDLANWLGEKYRIPDDDAAPDDDDEGGGAPRVGRA